MKIPIFTSFFFFLLVLVPCVYVWKFVTTFIHVMRWKTVPFEWGERKREREAEKNGTQNDNDEKQVKIDFNYTFPKRIDKPEHTVNSLERERKRKEERKEKNNEFRTSELFSHAIITSLSQQRTRALPSIHMKFQRFWLDCNRTVHHFFFSSFFSFSRNCTLFASAFRLCLKIFLDYFHNFNITIPCGMDENLGLSNLTITSFDERKNRVTNKAEKK